MEQQLTVTDEATYTFFLTHKGVLYGLSSDKLDLLYLSIKQTKEALENGTYNG